VLYVDLVAKPEDVVKVEAEKEEVEAASNR